jgi:hypothetical protein
MLSLISLGRGLWQKFQTAHPVIRWGGTILVGLVVFEFVADEAINLFIKMQTVRPTIEKANADAIKARTESQALSMPIDMDAFGKVYAERSGAVTADAPLDDQRTSETVRRLAQALDALQVAMHAEASVRTPAAGQEVGRANAEVVQALKSLFELLAAANNGRKSREWQESMQADPKRIVDVRIVVPPLP